MLLKRKHHRFSNVLIMKFHYPHQSHWWITIFSLKIAMKWGFRFLSNPHLLMVQFISFVGDMAIFMYTYTHNSCSYLQGASFREAPQPGEILQVHCLCSATLALGGDSRVNWWDKSSYDSYNSCLKMLNSWEYVIEPLVCMCHCVTLFKYV